MRGLSANQVSTMRKDARDVTLEVIRARYPDATVAFLGGSAGRGHATEMSDLDLVVVDPRAARGECWSFTESGWPVECFVETRESLLRHFARNIAEARPTLPRLCAEGLVLVDREGGAAEYQSEARRLLAQGPPPLAEDQRRQAIYVATNLIQDLRAAADPADRLSIALELATLLPNTALRIAGRWVGRSKFQLREYRAFDPARHDELVAAFSDLHAGSALALCEWGEAVVAACGGFVFDGHVRVTEGDCR
jgi:hypothetical protein